MSLEGARHHGEVTTIAYDPLNTEAVAPRGSQASAKAWASSGAQWLSPPQTPPPARLIDAVLRMTAALDERGAGMAQLVGSGGIGLLGERAAAVGLPPATSISCGGASRILATLDGWVVASMARPTDVELLPAWVGRDAGLDPWGTLEQACRGLESAEVVERGRLLGLACGAIAERRSEYPIELVQVGPALARPLDGMIVINLGSLWAGPLVGDILARLGARVIKIESSARPDGARQHRTFFEALHGRSESVSLQLDTAHGHAQLRSLLAGADIVIEGSRPRALEQMGIDAAALASTGPRLWLSITGHGRDEPYRNWVGFGDDAAVTGGLVGSDGRSPCFLADALADPLTGLTAAVTVAQLAERGGRWIVDAALSRTAAWLAPRPDDEVLTAAVSERPRRRLDPGGALPVGRDNPVVLAEFDIAP